MFSKACEYAIRSTIYIASESLQGNRVSLNHVAQKINSPEAFTSKILQKLVKAGVIQSIKGQGGGFEITKTKLNKIKLFSVIQAIDGDVLQKCSLGLHECSSTNPCPFHHIYKPIKDKLLALYNNTTILELTQNYINKGHFLKI